MDDPFLTAAREILDLTLDEFRQAIEGATPEMLNKRPAGEGTNSIAVLSVHAMHSTRWWLATAVGAPLPARNRDDEFVATMPDGAALLSFVTSMQGDCRRLLDGTRDVDWLAMRNTHPAPGEEPTHVTAAWALIHAMSHLREHAGHVQLTRQLLDTRSPG